jgi:hypothetical protein
MNLFEFTSFIPQDFNIETYDSTVRYDFARFLSQIESYVRGNIECVEVKSVKVYLKKILADDIIMANSFDILKELPEVDACKIRDELNLILNNKRNEFHASKKHQNNELFMNATLYEVSVANHGKTFHELFIEPLCNRIFNISSKEIPALFHRLAWLPLYYPETLLSALDGDGSLDKTLFHYPKNGQFSAIVDELSKKLRDNENITILKEPIIDIMYDNHFRINTKVGYIDSRRLIWGNDLNSLVRSFGLDYEEVYFERASLTFAFCVVKTDNLLKNFSVLYNLDNSSVLYRITDQDNCAGGTGLDTHRLVIEFNMHLLLQMGLTDDVKVLRYINEFLVSNLFIRRELTSLEVCIKSVRNAVNLPTKLNAKKFADIRNVISEKLVGVELIGSASSFFSTSFNDQIVQGLTIAAKN